MRGRGKEERRKVAGAAVVLKGGARDEGVEGVGKGREEKRGEASPDTRPGLLFTLKQFE